MFEDDKSKRKTPPPSATEEAESGSIYDPTVYHIIRAKRQRAKNDGTVKEFDKGVREIAKELDHRKAA